MKKILLHIVLFFCITQLFYAQEDGVVALDLPTRNSLKFNKYTINPTFSFVREQNRYITFYNKRQWVQFDDAPLTYLASYAGRFRENMGIGVGVFQQDYGVLTTFGGVLNFAYNAVLNTDSNLTFGMNLGFYKSGINEGRVNTNFPDPSLENIPSNSIITVNPGINYGTAFFDFGVSVNNAVSYNLQTSEIIEDNPEQSIQGHLMYTGYLSSRGFFDESKFSGLLRSEFKKDQTVISGLVMLNVPKGIWAQAGYNSIYGISGGLGLNITTQIAIEYNYEKAIGDLSTFGNSHEITLAYKFKNRERYSYSGDDDEQALLTTKKKKRVLAKNSTTPKLSAEERRIAKEEAQARIEARRLVAQTKVEERKLAAQQSQEKTEPEIQAKTTAEETRIRLEETKKAEAEKESEEERLKQGEAARIEAQKKAETQRLKLEEATKIKAATEAKERAEEQAKIKLAEEKAKVDAEAQVKAVEEAERKRIEEAKAKADEEDNIEMVELDGVLVPVAKDKTTREMNSLTKLTTDAKIEQQKLLVKLSETVANRNQDLKDLKEENDLSERGIYKAPKPFKSVTAENAILESLKVEIDNVILSQNEKIKELENLYTERLKKNSDENDATNAFYSKTIQDLKTEQVQALSTKENLLSTLEIIKVATEVERKRRIKRAAYDNEEDRYLKDRAALNQIKQFTPVASEPLTSEDFDSGEEQSSNIQIVKDVKNTESGFYVVIAVHSDVAKRDEFLRKAVAAGQANIDFFFDVNTSKYYIYYQKFNDIESARNAMELKGSKPYNNKMSAVKVEN
ncbi:PorP/SprF family type IX secretion system membrane protein [Wocania ichthyoenteri]|uniref:PorP/SprF family type IX secretion system membrane protein n=1 Tax=Wocania ichthyoenteri TaxID=1230531 RepID=UPI00053E6695|nr:PorP/SprF family type IX secretion system membrane protein [Wocania ichthyoenteri]